VIVVAAAAPGSGCGYALAGRGSFLPSDIRVIGVPLLENRTTTARIEQIITDKIRLEFINRGKKFDAATERADAVLTGTIMGLVTQPVGLTDQQLASRQLVTVTMRLQFTDSRNGQVLWSNEALTFREQYDLKTTANGQVDGAVLLEQEGPAFERLATDLARSVVTAILEAF
jgi:hypothetical protein